METFVEQEILEAMFDEMGKIAAAKKPDRFRVGIAAHELGHAKDYESSKVPALRTAGRVLGPLAGTLAGAQIARSNPVLGGLVGAAGSIPTLSDEFLASYHGTKALKESGKFEKKDLKKARNQLLQAGGTYLSGAAMNAGAALALGGKGGARGAGIGLFGAGLGTALGMGGRLERKAKGHIAVSKNDLEDLRSQMGVKGKIYAKKGKEVSAYYAPKSRGPVGRWMMKQQLKKDVSPKEMKQIFSEGGVVLPRAG